MIYDITQPLPECEVYPGDARPEKTAVRSMEKGDAYNLTNLSMCVHNGTHVDAPRHFLKDGKGVDRVSLERFLGPAFVDSREGELGAREAREILDNARRAHEGAQKKLLIRGKAVVTAEAAELFARSGVELIGSESQTVGPEDAPMDVHLILLGAEVVLLEGIRLAAVPDGVYFLSCAPLNLTDADGAPCRAVLMDMDAIQAAVSGKGERP